MDNWIPKIGDKVEVVTRNNGILYGNVIWIEPPNEYHSGRLGVHVHKKYYEYDYEFWYSDIGRTVRYCKK